MSTPWPERKSDGGQDFRPFTRDAQNLGWVYFFGHPDGSRIKVGYSRTVPNRAKQLATSSAWDAELNLAPLAFVRGSMSDEQTIHATFKEHRWAKSTKELFKADPLIPYVTWLRDQYYVSVSIAECQGDRGQVAMDASFWMPTPERRSYRRAEGLFADIDAWSFLPDRVLTADDYYTPDDILECVRQVLQVIDLDPASHVNAQEKVQAAHFFTKSQGGLTLPWFGRVFLNPPFDEWDLWLEKVLAELDANRIAEIILLGFTRTLSAQYFGPLLRRIEGLCIITGRRNFWGRATESDSAPDGVVMMYIGPNLDTFRRVFDALGPTWSR
jgi:hypothetical protein